MSLYLNKILQREKMKKISLILFGFLLFTSLNAEEQMNNLDKLDALDKQSKEFFNAITGLEKSYLEEQVNAIKDKQKQLVVNPNINVNQPSDTVKQIPALSQEDYEKNVFTHQNEIARLTTDFTRTKKLKDLKIKSMYSFNGKDYVVLELVEEGNTIVNKTTELSANIEGRYIEGDNILGHKIIDINTRTKSIELYKKLDEEYGYTIYLSNYGISVSDLKKIEKIEKVEKKEDKKIEKAPENSKVKEVFNKVEKVENKSVSKKDSSVGCYKVNVKNLNVRNDKDTTATILRILKIDDKFTIKEKDGNWVLVDTIYKKISGDIMNVSTENNWLLIADENVEFLNENCN